MALIVNVLSGIADSAGARDDRGLNARGARTSCRLYEDDIARDRVVAERVSMLFQQRKDLS